MGFAQIVPQWFAWAFLLSEWAIGSSCLQWSRSDARQQPRVGCSLFFRALDCPVALRPDWASTMPQWRARFSDGRARLGEVEALTTDGGNCPDGSPQ